MAPSDLNQGLLDFLAASPTPLHATLNLSRQLQASGYTPLDEGDSWNLQPGRYLVSRGGSLIAFNLPEVPVAEAGFRLLGAHTDSPCLVVKPNPDLKRHGYLQAGVEVYGGVLLGPWFDRDLSLAGRVAFLDPDDRRQNALINFVRPVAVIPSLAIHLDREANQKRSINPQTQLAPILLQGEADFAELLLAQLAQEGEQARAILDFDLRLYDTQAPALVGIQEQFIASARLDNLLSCYVGMRGLADADASRCPALLVCNDHEEVGSLSASGAAGPFLHSVLQRICPEPELLSRAIHRSLLISVDNAHGIHPNFADRHDANHGPLLNGGPVIKINANQRYATDSESASFFRDLCRKADVPCQSFVNRTDLACGSTIGPITSAETGISTLDLGVATFAMHSIRELAGAADPEYLYLALSRFLATEGQLKS